MSYFASADIVVLFYCVIDQTHSIFDYFVPAVGFSADVSTTKLDAWMDECWIDFQLGPFLLQFLYLPSILNLGTDNIFCLTSPDHKGLCIPSQDYSLYFCIISLFGNYELSSGVTFSLVTVTKMLV